MKEMREGGEKRIWVNMNFYKILTDKNMLF